MGHDVNECTLDLIVENDALFVILQTNVTVRPVKLMIDTGSAITLVDSNLFKTGSYDKKLRTNLRGISSSKDQVQTFGMASSRITFKKNTLKMNLHVIDKKCCVKEDGYLGFDFLNQYDAEIDMPTKKLIFYLK